MGEVRWTDDESSAEGVLLNGRITIFATPSMTADDGTVAVGIEVPPAVAKKLAEELNDG